MNSVDVIVIGAGLAGYCAAIEAAESGAEVLLLEKQAEVGGSSILSGGSFAFAGTPEQDRAGISDNAALLYKDMRYVGAEENDEKLVSLYTDHQLEAHRWLLDIGVQFGPIQVASGQSVPRLHSAKPPVLFELLKARAARYPRLRLQTGTRVMRLVRDPQTRRVTGVLTERDGGTETLRCTRGVVMASGGFSRNEELLRRFVPQQAKAARVGGPGNTGDGLLMAWELGAGFRDMAYIKGTFGNRPDARPEEHTALLAIYKGAIAVNLNGERFVDESISYKLIGDAVLDQPEARGYQIFDSVVMGQSVPGIKVFDFQKKLEEGKLLSAPTLDELAAKTGLPAERFKQSIASYNADAKAERDSRYGRTSLAAGYGGLVPVEKPPFYAYLSGSAIIATYCGLTVDTDMRVLDVFGNVIAGLYAAGEVTGGFHGVAFMTGTSLGKSTICGRVAGRNAAQLPIAI